MGRAGNMAGFQSKRKMAMDKQEDMVRVVYNASYGGFGLKHKAEDRYWEIKGQPKPQHWYDTDLCRHDPALLQVIDEMGLEEVTADYAELAITELPHGTKYFIDEYDGMETVRTIDDIVWSVAGE